MSRHRTSGWVRFFSRAGGRLCIPIILLVLLAAESPAADRAIGSLTSVRGTVTLKRPGIAESMSAEVGDELFVGDIVRTADGSSAQITLTDDTFLNLAQDSSVRVNQYVLDRERGRRTAVVMMLHGMVRCVIMKIWGAESAFRVLSAGAQITADSLDDFVIIVSAKETEVVCLNQSVRVRNTAPYVIGDAVVGVNQKTVVKENLPPVPPENITPAERKRYAIVVR